MKKQYEVLLMDADGTLLDFDKSEEESFLRVLEKYGLPLDKSLTEEYHSINKECWEAFEEGRMAREDVLTLRFERFFERHGMKVIGQEVEDFYRGFLEKGIDLIPGAMEVCEYLNKKYDLYIVTNGVAGTQYLRLNDSGLSGYFKGIFVSEEAGSQKPQKGFFDYCFQRIPGADKSTMLLIGDSLTSDMQGGLNAGVDTCWYNPFRAKNKKDIPVNYEIRDLHELVTFL